MCPCCLCNKHVDCASVLSYTRIHKCGSSGSNGDAFRPLDGCMKLDTFMYVEGWSSGNLVSSPRHRAAHVSRILLMETHEAHRARRTVNNVVISWVTFVVVNRLCLIV